MSLLITAVSYGELDMVRVLVEAGADPEVRGTAVQGACRGAPEIDLLLAPAAVEPSSSPPMVRRD